MIALMLAAVGNSETSVYFNEATRRFMSESCHLNARRRQNLKSHSLVLFVSMVLIHINHWLLLLYYLSVVWSSCHRMHGVQVSQTTF
jgi:hypothetical protein